MEKQPMRGSEAGVMERDRQTRRNGNPSLLRLVFDTAAPRRIILPALLALAGSAVPLMAGAAEGLDSAPSLTRAASAGKSPNADGFLQRWLILEPIRYSGALSDNAVKEAVRKEYFASQLSVIPHDGGKVPVGGEELTWHAVDTKEYNVNLYHFARALGKPTSNVLHWGVTIVNCPEAVSGVRLAVGSNAASVWWVNGQEVIGIYGDRQCVIDDGVSKRLVLKKGPNVIRCAVINGGGATDFCARLLDANEKPLKTITLTLGDVSK